MKINSVVMLSRAFYPAIGGAEKQALELARALARRGVKVTVLTGRSEGLPAEATLDGVFIKRFYSAGPAVFNLKIFFWLLSHGAEYQAVLTRLSSSAAAALAARVTGRKTLVKIAGTDEVSYLHSGLLGSLKLALLRGAGAELLVLNGEDAAKLKADPVFAGLGIHCLRNGVDTGRHTPPLYNEKINAKTALGLDNSQVFLCVGRLAAGTRVRDFIEAWAELFNQEAVPPRARLLVVGGGSEEAALRRDVVGLGLAGSVTLAGPKDDLLPYYRAADVFILPSSSGGLSNSMLEAMACGVAVMASLTGSAGEAVEQGVSGRLFDPRNRQEIKECLRAYITDRSLAVKMGEQARKTAVEKYSMARVADELLKLYGEN